MTRFYLGVAALLLCAFDAQAHHSAAAFDRTKVLTLNGEVKKFIWSNPHTWLHVTVPDGKGGTQDWELEARRST